MTRRALALTLALGLALGACGKYGDPIRSAPRQAAETSREESGSELASPESEQDRENEEQEEQEKQEP